MKRPRKPKIAPPEAPRIMDTMQGAGQRHVNRHFEGGQRIRKRAAKRARREHKYRME